MSEYILLSEQEPKEPKPCMVMDEKGVEAYAEPCFEAFKFIPCAHTKENKWSRKELVWVDNPPFMGWLIDVTRSFSGLTNEIGNVIKWKYL